MTAKELCAKVGITEANLSILSFDGQLEDEDDDNKETP